MNADFIYSSLGGHPDLGDLVELFVQEMPARIDALETQAQSRDWKQWNRTAHQLKGAAGSYGFAAITPYVARLEAATRNSDQEDEIFLSLHELPCLCRKMQAGMPPTDAGSQAPQDPRGLPVDTH
jgi:histidine phosphotransfer protein HptB